MVMFPLPQVPPGTRANNYWDNFRSYSRQNLLSTATKSNTSDLHPPSTTSTSTPAHTASFALHQARLGTHSDLQYILYAYLTLFLVSKILLNCAPSCLGYTMMM